MEVVSLRWFFTRIVTVSPSRHRKVGAGSEPLIVVAMRGVPVQVTADSPISRLNSVPLRLCAEPELVPVGFDGKPRARAYGDEFRRTPPPTDPWPQRRRGTGSTGSAGVVGRRFTREAPVT